MTHRYFQQYYKGYASLVICSLFILSSVCCHLLTYVYTKQLNHLFMVTQFIQSYSHALSGLRLVNDYFDTSDVVVVDSPRLTDFNDLNYYHYDAIKFKIIKTADTLYSYASQGDTQCILKASYKLSTQNIVLSNVSFYTSN